MSKVKKSSRWKFIKCPFFHSDAKVQGDYQSSIICEGGMLNSSCRQVFKVPEDMQEWEHRYCYSISGCQECYIYKGADEKYK